MTKRKIGILGYGKMGKTIDQLLQSTEHEVVMRSDRSSSESEKISGIKAADVIIEFTEPESAVQNLRTCLEFKTPVVCGTTGWLDQYESIAAFAKAQHTGFLYASNFSLGVNLFFHLNRKLARLMNKVDAYRPELSETHHVHKKDAPSGTAITLAEGLLQGYDALTDWHLTNDGPGAGLPVTAFREDEVPGTHTVTYKSAYDEIRIEHVAHSRQGFAEGAITAALWLIGKHGVFTMDDVLGLGKENGLYR